MPKKWSNFLPDAKKGFVRKNLFFVLFCLGACGYGQSVWSQADIKDVKPPIVLEADRRVLALLGILLMIVVGLLVQKWILSLWLRPTQEKDSRPPWDVALSGLDALQRQDLLTQGRYKEYYSVLSDIIRRYMEERFQIRAPEMTTPEFLASLQNTQGLTAAQKESLREFLESCDLVKFARFGPTSSQVEDIFAAARRLIEETRVESQLSRP